MSLVDLKKPQLHSIDSSGFQNLVIDGTKLIVSTDIVSQDVSFADIKSTSDTHSNLLQNVSNDGSAMTISSDIVVTGKATFNNVIENQTTNVTVADSFRISSDSQSEPGLLIQSSNTTQKPVSVSHDSTEVFSIATDGTITNVSVQSLETRATSLETRVNTAESDISTLESEMDTAETRIGTLETEVSDHESRLQITEGDISLLQSELDQTEIDVEALELKTQNITASTDETVFDVSTKVKWDSGEQYFTIKSRDTVSVTAATTVSKVLDFKSHQYSINSNQYGTYDLVLQCSDGDGTSPFYRASLVKYNGSAIIYPVSTYKTSATYDHSTDTIAFTFDEEVTNKQFVLSWLLVN